MLIDGVCYLCEGPIRGNCALITSWIAGGCSCGILKKEQFTIYLSQASLGMNKSLSTIHVPYRQTFLRMVSEDWNRGSETPWNLCGRLGVQCFHTSVFCFYCNRFKLTLQIHPVTLTINQWPSPVAPRSECPCQLPTFVFPLLLHHPPPQPRSPLPTWQESRLKVWTQTDCFWELEIKKRLSL